MDYVLLVLGAAFIIIGVVGCFVPVIPGPPLSFVALLLLHFTRWNSQTTSFLLLMAVVAIAVTVLDYVVPVLGTKKFGGTKRGSWGATIGVVLGLFFGPVCIILFPFIGAFIGELTANTETDKALHAAFGSFIGILAGMVFKLIASGLMTYYFIRDLLF